MGLAAAVAFIGPAFAAALVGFAVAGLTVGVDVGLALADAAAAFVGELLAGRPSVFFV